MLLITCCMQQVRKMRISFSEYNDSWVFACFSRIVVLGWPRLGVLLLHLLGETSLQLFR